MVMVLVMWEGAGMGMGMEMEVKMEMMLACACLPVVVDAVRRYEDWAARQCHLNATVIHSTAAKCTVLLTAIEPVQRDIQERQV